MNKTDHPFKRVAILGAGLLGGSLSMALREYCHGVHVRLWARKESVVEEARALRAADFCSSDLAQVVADCDLIVFSTPVGVMLSLAEKILPFVSSSVVMTDVGSVKEFVHDSLELFCKEHGLSFIGSHPMAGSEKQGIRNASADLFQGATVIVTGGSSTNSERVQCFWESLGGECLRLLPQEHDRLVAAISHMPHAMAAICAMAAGDCGNPADIGKLAAGGFRDTTRVAMGDPSMWAEILMENSSSVLDSLECCRKRIDEVSTLLRSGDKEALSAWLHEAGKRRSDIINSRP